MFIMNISESFFNLKFQKRKKMLNSLLCVGLDPIWELIPRPLPEIHSSHKESILFFLKKIVDYTKEYTVAYKLNSAFFENLGPQGLEVFYLIIQYIRIEVPEALVIADGKRGDIEHSASAYATAFFEKFHCDALTINPYMGLDTISTFSKYKDKASIVLCHTSNPGALDFQTWGSPPLYLEIARAMAKLNEESKNIWLVVGATQAPKSLKQIRERAPKLPFLIPGISSQKGDMKACLDVTGNEVLLNVSRGILYTAKSFDTLESSVRNTCETLLNEMREYI